MTFTNTVTERPLNRFKGKCKVVFLLQFSNSYYRRDTFPLSGLIPDALLLFVRAICFHLPSGILICSAQSTMKSKQIQLQQFRNVLHQLAVHVENCFLKQSGHNVLANCDYLFSLNFLFLRGTLPIGKV